MYYNLVGSLKTRLILELQKSFSSHPVYRKIVPYIQKRFSFDQRPQYGIVVQGGGANKVQLDPSNFVGHIQSHVMLAKVAGHDVHPIEWVREDRVCLNNNGGAMPTPAGVYFIEILQAPTNPNEDGYFVVDPLETVIDEPVIVFSTGLETEGQLQGAPLDGTLRLYENRQFLLVPGVDYNLLEAGSIQFLHNYPSNSLITADYRIPRDSIGPIPFRWNASNTEVMPGVVLAFGKRAEKGQKVAVVVYSSRVDAAQAYGGKFEATFDLSILARDTTQTEEISDLVTMYLWSDQKRSELGFEGIEVLDVSMSGEGEEPIDETGNDFQYTTQMTVQLQADWEIHYPLPLVISKISVSDIRSIDSNLLMVTHPVLVGRNNDFERIG